MLSLTSLTGINLFHGGFGCVCAALCLVAVLATVAVLIPRRQK